MRCLLKVLIPVDAGNAAISDGSLPKTIESILADLKPEAAYFGERDGKRGGILIVDVGKPSDVPRIAEPWFLNFNADVKFRVVMTPQDLAESNLEALGKKWG